eukprot:scaffold229376_cov28-Prasinocladus_malaysianus.AAC.1
MSPGKHVKHAGIAHIMIALSLKEDQHQNATSGERLLARYPGSPRASRLQLTRMPGLWIDMKHRSMLAAC